MCGGFGDKVIFRPSVEALPLKLRFHKKIKFAFENFNELEFRELITWMSHLGLANLRLSH